MTETIPLLWKAICSPCGFMPTPGMSNCTDILNVLSSSTSMLLNLQKDR